MKIVRIILGSLCSVTFGSLMCAGLWTFGVLAAALATGEAARALSEALSFGLYVLAIGGACALIAWAVVFVWIYSFVPRTSPLWHWKKCTACGAAAGFFLIGIPIVASADNEWLLLLGVYGGSGLVTGAAACWFAAVTANRFRPL